MNRKLLSISILFLSLGVSLLAGCGGGSGGGSETPPIEKGPSNDYLGLQVGAVLTYSISGTGYDGTYDNLTRYYRIVAEDEYPDPLDHYGYFKTVNEIKGQYKFGNYISKNADGTIYYYRGYWNDDPELDNKHHNNEDLIWVENPPKANTPYEFGILNGTQPELVSVPAGTFKAWRFVDTDSECIDTIWFVPYIGVVKMTYIEKDPTGETISDYTHVLVNYSF